MAGIEGETVLSPIPGTSDATVDEILVPPEVRQHAAEILKKRPKKGILKSSTSLDHSSPLAQIAASGDGGGESDHKFERLPSCKGVNDKDRAHFDEMNIMATLHPADKEYGHMKIDEPKTPYNYQSDSEAEDNPPSERVRRVSLSEHRTGVDAGSLSERLSTDDTSPKLLKRSPDDDEDGEETEEQRAKRKHFEMKRKMHYNEGATIKLAKQLMEKDEEEVEESPTVDSMES